MNDLKLDYFYGSEAEQFSFYRLPKILFTDSRYSKVSAEAKVLYGLLLDRMSLSLKNGWVDDENRVYIYFKLEDAMRMLNIGKDKGVKLFAELDSEKGCGLIKRKKQGLGKPTIIYVMNFVSPSKCQEENTEEKCDSETSEKPKSGVRASNELLTSEKPNSRVLMEQKSCVRKNRSLECGETETNNNKYNYNNFNYTEMNDTYPILSDPEHDTDVARYMEKEIREKISELPEKFAERTLEDFEKIKNGSPYNCIQIDDDEYIELHFEGEFLVLYSTGCPSEREYAGETKQIIEVKTTETIDEFREAYGFLSNFYLCDLDYNGVNYCCAESAFQAMKEANPTERINYSRLYPSDAKKKGRNCSLRSDWEDIKTDVMYDILKVKFSDEDLKTRLLLTGDRMLVEGNNWHDNFWGNCVCKKCKAIKGKNMLGILLMKLRTEIRKNK